MRRYEVATAAVLMVIAAVAMFDTRRTALPDPTGTAPGGIGTGFYPFWSSFFIFVAGAIVVYRSLTLSQPAQGVFKDRQSVITVLTLVIPIVVAASLLKWIGLYVMTAAYVGFFAATIGRYRWFATVALALLLPAAVYVIFELGFRVPLPKSIFSDVLQF